MNDTYSLPGHARLILDKSQIEQKIKRIAYEIYERNFNQEAIFMSGVDHTGVKISEFLVQHLEEISHFSRDKGNLQLGNITLDKYHHKRGNVTINNLPQNLENRVVILVDDVLNTGKTLAYCLPPLLDAGSFKIEIAVLVNRSHKLFPIEANYTGYELSTTIQDHIYVIMEGQNMLAYLE